MRRLLLFSIFISIQLLANSDDSLVLENVGGFVAGTIVHTFTGPETIQNIKVGDRLLSFDLATGKVVEQRVSDTHKIQVDQLMRILVEDEEIFVNPEHRFYIADTSEWILARDLQPGKHVLLNESGKHLAVKEAQLIDERSLLYDVTVEETQNYFVGNDKVLVHNFAIAAFMVPIVSWGAGGLTWTTFAAAGLGIATGVGIGLGLNALAKSLNQDGFDMFFLQNRGFLPADRGDGDRVRASYPVDIYIQNQGNNPSQRPDSSKGDIAGWAKNLGYDIRISPDRLPFNSHGSPGFKKNDRDYLTHDRDGHRGGIFKRFWKQAGEWRRETLDRNGNRIGD